MGDKRIPTVKWKTRQGWHERKTREEQGDTPIRQRTSPKPLGYMDSANNQRHNDKQNATHQCDCD